MLKKQSKTGITPTSTCHQSTDWWFLTNKGVVNHELMDLQVLILQIANRYNTDLDSEWVKHFKKSEKYLK